VPFARRVSVIQFVEECAIAGNCEAVARRRWKGLGRGPGAAREGATLAMRDARGAGARAGAEGRQAINTTRRHARRRATPKARFIRARAKGRVEGLIFSPKIRLLTAGSLVFNYRNRPSLRAIPVPPRAPLRHPPPSSAKFLIAFVIIESAISVADLPRASHFASRSQTPIDRYGEEGRAIDSPGVDARCRNQV